MAEQNGISNRIVITVISAVGGMLVGFIAMVTFLYAQFYTIREHEEFRKTMAETQRNTDESLKRLFDGVVDNKKLLAELQGFINAHKAK